MSLRFLWAFQGQVGMEFRSQDLEPGSGFPIPVPPLWSLASYATPLSLVFLICGWGHGQHPPHTGSSVVRCADTCKALRMAAGTWPTLCALAVRIVVLIA